MIHARDFAAPNLLANFLEGNRMRATFDAYVHNPLAIKNLANFGVDKVAMSMSMQMKTPLIDSVPRCHWIVTHNYKLLTNLNFKIVRNNLDKLLT